MIYVVVIIVRVKRYTIGAIFSKVIEIEQEICIMETLAYPEAL